MKTSLLRASIALAMSLMGSAPAAAIVYRGNLGDGISFVDYSITTDGTLGAITTDNFTDFSFHFSVPQAGFDLTAAFPDVGFDGWSHFIATSTELKYNFGGTDYTNFYIDGDYASARFCFGDAAVCGATKVVTINTPDNVFEIYESPTGLLPFASVPSAAPEPTTWAMMIMGFGAIAATMRKRGVGHLRSSSCDCAP